jgi:hypothetical protein
MVCHVDFHGKKLGKYNVRFAYHIKSSDEEITVSWIKIYDEEGNEIILYFANPSQVIDFVILLKKNTIDSETFKEFAELIAEGAK